MLTVQRISKPNLVDLLRLSDKRRWCQPRIRYASIRSKPELCRDLVRFFDFSEEDEKIVITPKKPILNFPQLSYSVKHRHFVLNGSRFDAARVSRQRPTFQFQRRKTVLNFGPVYCLKTPGNGTVSAGAGGFPLLSMSK